jgi:hypothetical protein
MLNIEQGLSKFEIHQSSFDILMQGGLMGARSELYLQVGLAGEQALYLHFGRPFMRIKPVVRCGLGFYRSVAVN